MKTNNFLDQRIIEISQKVVQAAQETINDTLVKVYLFGSYARGDYNSESDIDFLIIANVSQEEACAKHMELRKKCPA